MKINILLLLLLFLACGKKSDLKYPDKPQKISSYQVLKDCLENLEDYKPSGNFIRGRLNIYINTKDATQHFLTCDEGGKPYLRLIEGKLDIESLVDHGEFWTDKFKVYYEYSTSDGVNIYELKNVDRSSFTALGNSIYGKDKNHVFDSRHGIVEEADLDSFKPIFKDSLKSSTSYAKDKNNYFFWDEVITDSIALKDIRLSYKF